MNPLQYPRITLGIFLFLLLFLGWHTRNFEIDASAETLLLKNDRNYLLTRLAGQRYQPEEFILVAIKPTDGQIFSESTFALLQQLTEEIEQIERVESVRSLLNMPLFIGIGSLSADIDPDELTWGHQRYSQAEMKKYWPPTHSTKGYWSMRPRRPLPCRWCLPNNGSWPNWKKR